MQQEKKDFLTLAIPPARLNITETAWFLGFTESACRGGNERRRVDLGHEIANLFLHAFGIFSRKSFYVGIGRVDATARKCNNHDLFCAFGFRR